MNFKNLISALLVALAFTACGVDDATVSVETEEDWVENDAALSARGKFETFVARDGRYYFHLLAGNGEKVLASQGYGTLAAALNGIESVKENGTEARRFLVREASDGSWYFVVAAANGEILASSEMYASQSNANRAMSSVATIVRSTTSQGAAITGDAKFEIFKGIDSRYYFHVRALNGAIVLQSQPYTSRTGAINGALSVQSNGRIATRYTVLPAADGSFYFTVKAANGATVGRSELYVSKYNAQRGAADVLELLQADLPR